MPEFPPVVHNIERFNPKKRYLEHIKEFINVELFKKAKLKVVYDPIYGSGRDYMGQLLQELGCQVEEIHGYRDVLFGGGNPEPSEEYLGDLMKQVVKSGAAVGLANDGDADRFGIVNEKGEFLEANKVIALVFEYLVTDRGISGSVVRSVATTSMIDKVAALHKIKLHETPVGFKYIAEVMMKEDVIIGGEESGGLSILGHIPEKDGILACLLVSEMIIRRGKPLSQIYQDLIKKIGPFYQKRINLHLTEEKKQALVGSLKNNPPKEFAGIKVVEVKTIDGVKLVLDGGSWLLIRPSGTEPLVRIYLESQDQKVLDLLVEEVQKLV
ncbi:MAG: hypothetical protein NT099_03435 [Candidatus Saganbacteria bacterium]|nr:hypothetical protein [Candidatus Saganbacteria bacterium]